MSMSHTSVPDTYHSFQCLAECGKKPRCDTLRTSVCVYAKTFADPVAYAARIGLGDDRNAMSAFLFTFPGGNTSAAAEKLPKAGNLFPAALPKDFIFPQALMQPARATALV